MPNEVYKQGIIFTGGENPPLQFIKTLINKEPEALIIAADSGLLTVENAGFKADWIIGDMDSLGDKSRLNHYPLERIVRFQHNKDFTDTEAAFSLAIEQGCSEIWIIGGGGGRIDHLFGIRSLFERDFFPDRWITDTADIRCIKECDFCCILDKEACVSVFPLGDGPWEAKSSGLKWPLEGLPWNRGFFGLSNVAVEGEFVIKAEKGRFMVVLPVNKN